MPTTVNGIVKDGVYIRPTPPPVDLLETTVTATQFIDYSTGVDAWTYPPPTTPSNSIVPVFNGSRQVTEDFFGMHVQDVANIPAAIAQVPFKVARSHDSGGSGGMRWCTLNPANGIFDWTNSDAWVNAMYAAGKDIIFTLGFTPDWASATTPNTGKYDNGTTNRATNQPPSNTAYWDSYVTAVFNRYLGKIKKYELWNECNYTAYWSGSAAQLAVLLRRTRQILTTIDPTAIVIGPIVQEPETGGTGSAYLTSVLTASDSASGTGKLWINKCGIHMYWPKYNPSIEPNQIANVQAVLTAQSLAVGIVNTEFGILEPSYGVDDAVRAKWLAQGMLLAAALGVECCCWYSYDNDQMYMRPSQIAIWNEVRNLLLAAPLTGCNLVANRVAVTIGGVNYLY